MTVCFIGKHKYPKDIFSNELDLKTWRSLGAYFNKLFIIAQSPDLLFHFGKEDNIRIYLLPRLGYLGFIFLAVVFGIYLNFRYGVNVFDASEVAGGGVAVMILKFLTGKLSVIEIQGEVFRKVEYGKNFSVKGGPASGWKNWLLKQIGRFIMKHAARIRVISNAIFDQVRKQGIAEEKIRLVSLRVDLTLFNPNGFVESIRQTLYFGDKLGIINIGYIGRLVDGKRLEDLLAAAANLKSQFQISNFKLLIFGQGAFEFKLKKTAKNLGIEDKIEWRGFVPYTKIPEALSQIDIFVYPSWHEGFGRSIMEALAMEKAVVATRVGGIPDLIKDGENGFLVEPHNPEALAEKIKELMQNKNLCEKFGKAGKEWVSQNFEWSEGIKKFANLFLELK